MTEQLLVKKLNPLASLPERGSIDAAGLDVRACLPDGEALRIPGMISLLTDYSRGELTDLKANRLIIPTGLSMRCPEGTYVRAAPRSGLSVKSGIHVMAGVIDIDYTGEVGIVLCNLGLEDFAVRNGDRVAQLILERISMADAVEVDSLDPTQRGADGYGSTGTN